MTTQKNHEKLTLRRERGGVNAYSQPDQFFMTPPSNVFQVALYTLYIYSIIINQSVLREQLLRKFFRDVFHNSFASKWSINLFIEQFPHWWTDWFILATSFGLRTQFTGSFKFMTYYFSFISFFLRWPIIFFLFPILFFFSSADQILALSKYFPPFPSPPLTKYFPSQFFFSSTN